MATSAVMQAIPAVFPAITPSGLHSESIPSVAHTIAVPAVLAVFNWSKGNDRYRRVERFVEGLFTKWDKFLEPPRHPKWRDVNLAATVPGWTRWSVANEMLKRVQPKDTTDGQVADFSAFLKDKSSAAGNLTPEQRETLSREFLLWREKRGSMRQ